MIFVINRKINVIFTDPNKTFLYIFIYYTASWWLFLLTLFKIQKLYGVWRAAIFLIITASMKV